MKPRIFISSTYYDLKHIRADIKNFIDNYGFDSVVFESGDVTFEHNKPLDASCYQEVEACHMMILIIGGRYGSLASNNTYKEQEYEDTYISITRREFETARSKNMHIFVFIDKDVYAEYHTYKKNKDFLLNNQSFNFAHVDSINVFRFIESLSNIAIKSFEKASEITEYLKL